MMIENFLKSIGVLCSIVLYISCGNSDELKLFNGDSLEGW